ncbi:MAG: PaaI family thioesterase [Gaiellaceae bacterium]
MLSFPELLQAMIRGEVDPPPVATLVGLRLVSAASGRAVFQLEVERRHANPMGTVHGGILCDLADAAMGVSFASTLGDGESFTTLELKISFLRPVRTGLLTATGAVVERGRTIGLVECRVIDPDDRLVAHATSTCMVLRGEAAAGR